MHWKLKSKIQNAIAVLPDRLSAGAYYWVQRHLTGLRTITPENHFMIGVETWRRLCSLGYRPRGKVFLEVGTGRAPLIPLAYWLMGAAKITTMDLNPYLKAELVKECLGFIAKNQDAMVSLFGPDLDKSRLQDLIELSTDTEFSLAKFFAVCEIQYLAPGNAAKTGLDAGSIDFHTSYNVFEHIPVEVLRDILDEGNRIISDNGLFMHRIDYSDHFSHSDKKISAINFLQFSDAQWRSYAGNQFMYTNRLRHDDFLSLFQSAGHRFLMNAPDMNRRSLSLIKSGKLRLADRFKGKSEEVIAISGAWLASQKTCSKSDLDSIRETTTEAG